MARFENQEAEGLARDFIREKSIKVDLLNTHVDGKAWYDVTVYTPRGSVKYTDYSPGYGGDIYDEALVLSDLIAFTRHVTDYEDADEYAEQYGEAGRDEFHAMCGRAEVLEALTGHDLEYLDSVFATY